MNVHKVDYLDDSGQQTHALIGADAPWTAIVEHVGDVTKNPRVKVHTCHADLESAAILYETSHERMVMVTATKLEDDEFRAARAAAKPGKGGVDWVDDDGGRDEWYQDQIRQQGLVGDCVVRALSIASGTPYESMREQVVRSMEEHGQSWHTTDPDDGVFDSAWWPVAESLGFERFPIWQLTGNKTMGVKRAVKLAPVMLLASKGHVVAAIDGLVHDTWDSTGSRIVEVWMLGCVSGWTPVEFGAWES